MRTIPLEWVFGYPKKRRNDEFKSGNQTQARECRCIGIMRDALLLAKPNVRRETEIVGCHHGHFTENETETINVVIRASKPDVVLVAMGNPKQELWLGANLRATGARLGFAVGALFDFATGDARRAPAWMGYLRLEWLYRLLHEPVCGWGSVT
jgi:exopolysaccharide biosynthesis WecB/TagA/CpsF family protein